ncbi:unnamed protein product [Rotaria socialis]
MLLIRNIPVRSIDFSVYYSSVEKQRKNISISSSTKLNCTLTKFIDYKQYEEALKQFGQQPHLHTDFNIGMAITACTMLHDYERAINLLQKLPSNNINPVFHEVNSFQLWQN